MTQPSLPPPPQFTAWQPPEPDPPKRPLWPYIAVGALVLTGAITALALLVGSPGEQPFTAPPGSVAASREEQDLLHMHEAFGTLKPGDIGLQRAIIDGAHSLCRQLDRGATTPELWTAIAADRGLAQAATYTDFAIHALCPQHAT